MTELDELERYCVATMKATREIKEQMVKEDVPSWKILQDTKNMMDMESYYTLKIIEKFKKERDA